MTTFEHEIDAVAEYPLDVAPIERGMLAAALDAVLRATGDLALCQDVESAALAYAREAAGRAGALGLALGREAGRR